MKKGDLSKFIEEAVSEVRAERRAKVKADNATGDTSGLLAPGNHKGTQNVMARDFAGLFA